MKAAPIPSLLLLLLATLLPCPHTTSAADPSTTQTIAPTANADNYSLTQQDQLLFSIQEDPRPASTPDQVQVNPLGEIHFRVSQGFDDTITIRVTGKSLAQVKEELKTRLDADYYQNATVELKLREQAEQPGQVLFFGAVRSNFLPLEPNNPRTVFEGVYQVGVSEFANLKKVKLHRIDPTTRKSRSWLIDLEAIKKGNREQDIPLQDGDRVEVPEKRIVF